MIRGDRLGAALVAGCIDAFAPRFHPGAVICVVYVEHQPGLRHRFDLARLSDGLRLVRRVYFNPSLFIIREMRFSLCDAVGLLLFNQPQRFDLRFEGPLPGRSLTCIGFGFLANRIELIQPTDEVSGVARFLASRGEGLHHVCLRSRDLPRDLASLAAREAELIDKEPRSGADGMVAFVHPRTLNGVLWELIAAQETEP